MRVFGHLLDGLEVSPKFVDAEGCATRILTVNVMGNVALPGASTMDRPYKPQGYSSVSPYVVADGAQGLIDFLIKSFDARQTRRYDMPDGSIMHAEVHIDDTVVMIADGADDNPAFPIWLHVYVPDVDASYQRALEAGGLPVDEPEQREGDPDRRAGVKDPAGNTWWIATQFS
jgi:PhnB protein